VSQRGVRISKMVSRRDWPVLTLLPFFAVHSVHTTRLYGLMGLALKNCVELAEALRDAELLLRWFGALAYVQPIPIVSRRLTNPTIMYVTLWLRSTRRARVVSCLRKTADNGWPRVRIK
jgi:hypothetical protein